MQEVGAMRDSITTLGLVPVGIVLSIAVITGSAAYLVQRRATPGRIRDAMAYQVRFLAGLASVLTAFATAVIEDTPIDGAGMLAAFFGPFAGMVNAELRTLSQDASVAAQVHSSFQSFRYLLDPLSANPG
jgi:hypothetical protein